MKKEDNNVSARFIAHPPPTTSGTSSAVVVVVRILSDPYYAPIIGLLVRLFLAWFLPWLLDGGKNRFLPGVNYTDIDFLVFSDAADYINRGLSPYDRHTYRYTPFLAALLSKLPTKEYGRYLFCIADAICGYIILHERRSRRRGRKITETETERKRQKEDEHDDDDNDDNNDNNKDDKQHQQPESSSTRNQTLCSQRFSWWWWSVELEDAIWWLYNPLAINICTRGSAESLMVLLPVLLTFWIATSHERRHNHDVSQQEQRENYDYDVNANDESNENNNNHSKKKNTCTSIDGTISHLQVFLCGLTHGVAIHSKLYPIIYSLSYMAYFATPPRTRKINGNESAIIRDDGSSGFAGRTAAAKANNKNKNNFPWTDPMKLIRLAKLWIHRLLFSTKAVLFLVTFLVTFGSLQWLAVHMYGRKALEEGLLYHFSRVDHRHNYSIFWYWIYLARGRAAINIVSNATSSSSDLSSLATMGRLLLVPQAFLLAFSSLGMATNDGQLGLTLFVQTYLFVIHNKVITAQYFTWYLCLLPLCSRSSNSNNSKDNKGYIPFSKVIRASIILVISILFWLGSAYGLEMRGLAFHRIVWLASVLYFFANVNLLGTLLQYFAGGGSNDVVRTTRSERSNSSVVNDNLSKKNN